MASIGPLAFGVPWVLFALIALPIIWWLLRVTPPAPKRVPFPAVRLLLGLQQKEETPARTPLWLLLLRMAVAGLAILALADPYVNPQSVGLKRSTVVIVVDNGWAAAARWDDRVGAMQTLAAEAERDGRPLVVVPTALSDAPVVLRPLSGADAQGAVKAVAPQPFGVDRAKALVALQKLSLTDNPDIIWLTDGLEDGNAAPFARALAGIGSLRVQTDDSLNAALAITPPKADGSALVFRVLRGKDDGEVKGTIRATGTQGRFLAAQEFTLNANQDSTEVKLDLATELRNDLARVEVADRQSAGSVALIDERWRRRPVGLISGQTVDTAQPLLSDLFYLNRALVPYAEIHTGKIGDLLKSGLSVLVLADVGQIVGDDKRAATEWVAKGGVLIRFSGPKLAAQSDDLIPGKLRTGGRLLDGALSWSEPQKLSTWTEESPFFGLPIPEDVSIKRQVLTEPGVGTDIKTWAQLADGTPLVTATRLEKGWLVLFHVTANTEWSSLPISGLFVEMLRRTIALSSGVAMDDSKLAATSAPMQPAETLDGFGRLGTPSASALPMRGTDFDTADASPRHPPGFYGEGGVRRAFNLFKPDATLKPLAALPAGIPLATFGLRQAVELKYVLMAIAIALALLDLIAGLILRGLVALPRLPLRTTTAVITIAFGALAAIPDQARADDAFAMKATLNYRLGYVVTGDPEVDAMSRAGLKGLTRTLRERTAVEPGDPMPVDIEQDELAFFPLLYWPVTTAQSQLSANALAKVDAFMRNGGTIVFDTRDQDTALPAQGGSQTLRRLLAGLDIPPLQPLAQDHVLTRAFYLLREYPGRWASGRVWVEAQQKAGDGAPSTTASDGVSPIIVGGADWAAAWAQDDAGRPLAAVVPGGTRQRELAMRFGVNLVMYTLTGNYKTDQVHVPAILERLGQ
ncbi:MAG: DUF4159 domain-containing protein [Alphaproteobacteria bacterium]|nr:DUF4159 domain-containing protein [Alphaproteobacteria bacterium]